MLLYLMMDPFIIVHNDKDLLIEIVSNVLCFKSNSAKLFSTSDQT